MNKILASGTDFIWKNARSLERAIFEYNFFNTSPTRILDILRTYQNDDGGFGHALEPDLRCPDSQPLFVEFALRTLYDNNLRDPQMADQVCGFISSHASLENGIPLVFPSSSRYPHAGHMDSPSAQQPAMDRLAGLVGMLLWQGISHPWLDDAVEACVAFIENSTITDAHTILTAFCLVEALSTDREASHLFDKLSADLLLANFFNLDPNDIGYGLTPLTFAPAPGSFCRRIFTGELIDAHLELMAGQQEQDGGWPIQWEPPSELARLEWRASRTVMALSTLRAYGRL